jgi:hypothetical protein
MMWRFPLVFVVAAFAAPAFAQPVTLDQATAGHLYSFLANGGTFAEADLLRGKMAEAIQASRVSPPTPEHPPVTQAKPDAPTTPNPPPATTPN